MSIEGVVRGYFESEADPLNMSPARLHTKPNAAWMNLFKREIAGVVLRRMVIGEIRVYCGLTLKRIAIKTWTVEYIENGKLRAISKSSISKMLDYMFEGLSPSRGSRYKGVYRNATGWSAIISHRGQTHYLGWRKIEAEAAELYNDFVREHNLARDLNEVNAGAGG